MSRDVGGGSAAMPTEHLRELTRDGGVWCQVAVVTDRTGHGVFEIEDGDCRIDLKLQSGEYVWARLGGAVGGRGVGMYSVPEAGAECLVALPDGRKDGEAVIVAFLSTGQLPDGFDGSGTIVIAVKAGQKVLIYDGNASDAKALVTKADFDGHTHPLPQINAPAGTAGGPCTVNPSVEVGDTKGAPAATGTQVLQAK